MIREKLCCAVKKKKKKKVVETWIDSLSMFGEWRRGILFNEKFIEKGKVCYLL